MSRDPFANIDFKNPVVTLSNATLTPELLKDLCSALSRVPSVTQLNLAHNDLGDEGAEILAELVSQKPQIVHLNLKNSRIADTGTSILCKALSRHASCKHLNLSANPISDIGLAELSKFVSYSTDIEVIDLVDCPISLRGTLSFADALVRNESLVTVRLPHTLGHRVLSEVARLMKRNWLRRNKVDERRVERAVQQYEEDEHDSKIASKWRPVQPMARPLPPASGFTLEEWSDKDLAPILMSLEVLDRKQKLLKKLGSAHPDELDADKNASCPWASHVSSRAKPLPKKSALPNSARKNAMMMDSKARPGWSSARQALAVATASQVPKLPPLGSGRQCW